MSEEEEEGVPVLSQHARRSATLCHHHTTLHHTSACAGVPSRASQCQSDGKSELRDWAGLNLAGTCRTAQCFSHGPPFLICMLVAWEDRYHGIGHAPGSTETVQENTYRRRKRDCLNSPMFG